MLCNLLKVYLNKHVYSIERIIPLKYNNNTLDFYPLLSYRVRLKGIHLTYTKTTFLEMIYFHYTYYFIGE